MSSAPTTVFRAAAPGRVNLIGEHTDYNGGFVLPTALPLDTRVEIRPRQDRRVNALSHTAEGRAEYELGQEERTGQWFDYLQGVTWALQREEVAIGGFDAEIWSDVPLGAGLSSSASLEVALLRAING